MISTKQRSLVKKHVFRLWDKERLKNFLLYQRLKKSKYHFIPVFFKRVIRQTIFSISDNENTKLMTGELFEVKDDQLSVVSLDGHRISIRHIELKDHYDPFKVVVPGKTLQEIVEDHFWRNG